jgi:hypothetical protein
MSQAVPIAPLVTIEFFGMARQQAGCVEMTTRGRTLAEVLAAVQVACPALNGLVEYDGQINRQFLVSIDAGEFLTDSGRALESGERVLILGADVGG